MRHEPALDAGRYIAGELGADAFERFEAHLLECEECWAEVEAARRGVAAAGSARELAPPGLRDRVRGSIRAASGNRPARRVLVRPLVIAAAAAVVTAVGAGFWLTTQRAPDTSAVVAAVTGYERGQLPGSAVPGGPAPDLSRLQLAAAGSGAGMLGDMHVDAYAFRDRGGRRVTIYSGERGFTMPPWGDPMDGIDGPWIAHREGIAILASRAPHDVLIVGTDEHLVHDVAVALQVM